MQDGASSHSSKETKRDFFDKNGFTPMDWPPQSPDLNPIENVWSILKGGLWKRRSEIKNQKDTWRIAQEIWYNISDEIIKKMYRSLPDRCMKVARLQGMRIKTH